LCETELGYLKQDFSLNYENGKKIVETRYSIENNHANSSIKSLDTSHQ